MNNIDDEHRELIIQESLTDIGTDTLGGMNEIFDLAADHFGSDDDLHYMIHEYAQGMDTADLRPRSIAFLRLLAHIPTHCPYCD